MWIFFELRDGRRFLGYSKTVCNPCDDYSNSGDCYDEFYAVEPKGVSCIFREKEIAGWHYVKHGKFYWETFDGKMVDVTSPDVPQNNDPEDRIANAQRAYAPVNMVNNPEIAEEILFYEVLKSKAEDMRNWLLLNAECADDITLVQISDNALFLESSREIKLNAPGVIFPENLIVDSSQKLSLLKKTISSLENERAQAEDPEKKQALNKRISQLQQMLKPMKNRIEYENCIERELSTFESDKN